MPTNDQSNRDIQALPKDKASRILLAIQDSDTVLLRNIFPGNIAQTYQLDPEQIIDEACDTLSFTDEEYGTETVTRAQLNQAVISAHAIVLPPEKYLRKRSILCYVWHPLDLRAFGTARQTEQQSSHPGQ